MNSNWTVFHQYISHTAWDGVSYPIISGLSRATFMSGEMVQTSPVVADGYLYVANMNGDIYQLNATNVSQMINSFHSGGVVISSPAVVNGYVYFGSGDSNFYQLNATNLALVNSFSAGGAFEASPVVANGYVYAGADDTYIYQLNATNVSVEINRFKANDIDASGAYVDNSYLYVGDLSGYIYQLNATNISQQIANFSTEGGIYGSAPTVYNGSLYVASLNVAVFQLNATNVSREIARFVTRSDGTYNSPAAANGYIYIGGLRGELYQLNAANISGTYDNLSSFVALFETDGDIQDSATVGNGYVYIGDKNGYYYQLDATNISRQVANLTIGSHSVSTPALTDDYIYFGSNDGNVYQINATNISLGNYDGCVDLSDPSTFQHKLDGDLDGGLALISSFIMCPKNYSSTATTIMTVLVPNVTIDCDGANIFGSGSIYGVQSEENGTHIINCNFREFDFSSIWYIDASDMSVENTYADDGFHGLVFDGVTNGQIINTTALGVDDYGIRIISSNGINITNTSALEGLYVSNVENLKITNVYANVSGNRYAMDLLGVPDVVINGCMVEGFYYTSMVLLNAPRASVSGCTVINRFDSGYAIGLSDTSEELRTDNGTFTNNIFMSLGEGETVAVGLSEVATGGNVFYNNVLQADVWVHSSVEDENYFNNSDMGNKYYLKDGTAAWKIYDLKDNNGDNWADTGADWPFNENLSGGEWVGIDYDYHPYTEAKSASSGSGSGKSKKIMKIDIISSCKTALVTLTDSEQPIADVRVYANAKDQDSVDYTDEKGQVQIPFCNDLIRLEASKENYVDIDADYSLICSCPTASAINPQNPNTNNLNTTYTEDATSTKPQCVKDTDCKNGEICNNGLCKEKAAEIIPLTNYKIVTAAEHVVGREEIISIIMNDAPCKNCNVQISSPKGERIDALSDENGLFKFTPKTSGAYVVSLLFDGKAVESEPILVTGNISKATDRSDTATSANSSSWIWILILTLVVICAVIFWFYRRK